MIIPLLSFVQLAVQPVPFGLKEIGTCLPNRPLLYRGDKPGYGYADKEVARFFDEHGKRQSETFPIQNYMAAFALNESGSLLEAGGTRQSGMATMVRANIFRSVGFRWALDRRGSSYLAPTSGGGIGISTDSKTIALFGSAPVMPLVWISEQTKSGDYLSVRQVVPCVIDVGSATLMYHFTDVTFISPTIAVFIGQMQHPIEAPTLTKWAETLTDLRKFKLYSTLTQTGRDNECFLFALDTTIGITKGLARFSFNAPEHHYTGDFGAGTLISSSDDKWLFLKVGEKVIRLTTDEVLKFVDGDGE